MQTNVRYLVITLILLCSISNVMAVEGYGTTTSWIDGIQGCDQNFEITISGHNITNPNTFTYTLEYYLVYRNADDVETTIELETQSFSKSLPVGTESWETFKHFIPTFSLNSLIQEVESGDQCATNKTRYVKIVYDSTLTDDGGTHDDADVDYVWFTECYGSDSLYDDSYVGREQQDHGFDINSIAGEGGSGALSNMVGWGDMDETSKEHKNLFDIFFFTLIPIIFIMLIANVMGKIL